MPFPSQHFEITTCQRLPEKGCGARVYRPVLLRWPRWFWRLWDRLRYHWWCAASDLHIETVIGTRRHTVRYDTLLELIHQERHNIYHVWKEDVREIVVGPAQLNLLEEECFRKFSFFFPPGRHPMDRYSKINGMNIHVIPWFDGILLLPKLDSSSSAPIPRQEPTDGPPRH